MPHDQNGRPAVYKSTTVEVLALIAISCTSMLNAASQGALQIALPRIGQHFDISSQRLTWVMSSFTLTSGSLLLFLASLSDIFGRKKMLVFSYVWFVIWSIASGIFGLSLDMLLRHGINSMSFAQTDIQLDIFRALCGLGSAGAVPAAVGILGNVYKPGTRQNKAFACLSGANPLGFIWGILCGGIATQVLGWRAHLFFMSIVFSGIAALAWFFVPEDKHVTFHQAGHHNVPDTNKSSSSEEGGGYISTPTPDLPAEAPTVTALLKKVDYLGAFLITAGSLLFVFALTQSSEGWSKPEVISALVLGIALILGFIGWEYYLGENALMPLYIWKYPNFSLLMVIIALGWINFAGIVLLDNALWFQDVNHVSPLGTTARFIPMAVAGALVNVFAAYTLHIISSKKLLIVGMISFTGAAMLWAFNQPTTSYWAMPFPALILTVVGADLVFMVVQIFVLGAVPPQLKSTAGGILATVVLFGQSVGYGGGAAVQGAILNKGPKQGESGEDLIVRAFHGAYWLATAVTVVGTILCFFVKVGRQGNKKDMKNIIPEVPPNETKTAVLSNDISEAEEGRTTPENTIREEKGISGDVSTAKELS